MNETDKISSFLYYGYLPDYQPENISNIFSGIDSDNLFSVSKVNNNNESIIVEQGIQALKTSFLKLINRYPDSSYIVPLSGGFDSRAILAALLDFGLKDQITTATFGVPGAWDFELGCHLAKELDLNHFCIDLNKVEVSTEKLVEIAKTGSLWTFLIDAYYNSLICREFGKTFVYWSGFLGDDLGDAEIIRMNNAQTNPWIYALNYFAKHEGSIFVKSIDLTAKDFNPTRCLPSNPILEGSVNDYRDQLNIFVYDHNYIKRVITFNNFNYQTPFCSPDWVQFILSVPRKYRAKKYIYKKILFGAYPEIFSFPCTENCGGNLSTHPIENKFRRALHRIRKNLPRYDPLWNHYHIFRNIKYIDFDQAIRCREDFKSLVFENLQDLKQRDKVDWLNLDSIWKEHHLKRANHGLALMLLTALEINLKVDEENVIVG